MRKCIYIVKNCRKNLNFMNLQASGVLQEHVPFLHIRLQQPNNMIGSIHQGKGPSMRFTKLICQLHVQVQVPTIQVSGYSYLLPHRLITVVFESEQRTSMRQKALQKENPYWTVRQWTEPRILLIALELLYFTWNRYTHSRTCTQVLFDLGRQN